MAEYSVSHIRFPETIQEPIITFHAKKWEHSDIGIRKTTSSVRMRTDDYIKQSLGSVSLYLPSFSEHHSVTWDSANEFLTNIAQGLNSVVSGITATTASDALKLHYGAAVSQDSIATFKDVNARQFSFDFTLIPSTPTESVIVKNIMDFFRFHSLPTYSATIIDFPSIFDVSVLGIVSLNGVDYFQFKPMHLVDMNVTYGDGNHMQLFKDSTPTKVKIQLQFSEVTKPYKNDFEYQNTKAST